MRQVFNHWVVAAFAIMNKIGILLDMRTIYFQGLAVCYLSNQFTPLFKRDELVS